MAKSHVAVLDAAGLKLEDILFRATSIWRTCRITIRLNAIYKEYFFEGPGVRTTLMPSNAQAMNEVRVTASFIAAKTQGRSSRGEEESHAEARSRRD